MHENFADIRPYDDDEVPVVLKRLLASKELRYAIIHYFYPKLPKWSARLVAPVLFARVKKSLKHVKNVADFQRWLSKLLDPMLKKSITDIEVRGLENLSKGTPYLWISNHRDIAMDPLLVNYCLLKEGWPTSRIAIGDNLLNHPDVADIMRLNKCFVVKRNIANNREKLKELKKLSNYIRFSIDNGHSIWIAQREGRAKDGIDKTDTAVLKMLALHGRERKEDFTTSLKKLTPVPVSIQYEWDPCDVLKARELISYAQLGSYQKSQDEDTRSILLGLIGRKGRVIVSFGTPLTTEELANAETTAQAIDRQILSMNELLGVQRAALAMLKRTFNGYEHVAGDQWIEDAVEQLQHRAKQEKDEVIERLLKTYAAPLLYLD